MSSRGGRQRRGHRHRHRSGSRADYSGASGDDASGNGERGGVSNAEYAGSDGHANVEASLGQSDEYGGDAGGDVDYEGGDYDDGDEYNDGGEYDDADGGDYGDEYAYGQDAGFADEVIKEGWLTKSNPQGKRWKKRWCVLTYAEFTYYTSAEKRDRQSKGSFELADVEVREGWDLERSPRTPHVLTVNVPGRAYYFCCSSDEVLGEWLDAFNLALGYDEDGYADGDGYDDGDGAGDFGEYDGQREDADDDDMGGGDAGVGDAGVGDAVVTGDGGGRRDESGADDAGDDDDGDGDDGDDDAGSDDGGSQEGRGRAGEADDGDAAAHSRGSHGTGTAEAAPGVSEGEGGTQSAPHRGRGRGRGRHRSRRKKRRSTDADGDADGDAHGDALGGSGGEASGAVGSNGAGTDTEQAQQAPVASAGAGRLRAPSTERADEDGKHRVRSVPGGASAELDESPAQVGLVRFTVERSQVSGGSAQQRVWTIVAKEGKAARMTVAKIKRYIAKHSQPPVAPAAMQLRIGDEPLLDAWTGADFGLTDGTRIVLDVVEVPAVAASKQGASGGAVGTAAAGTAAADGGGGGGGGPDVMHRIEKRLQLRRVFQGVAGSDPGAVVARARLRDAIAADKAATAALAGSSSLNIGLQGAGDVSWVDVSRMLRSEESSSDAADVAALDGGSELPSQVLMSVALDEAGGVGEIAVVPDSDPDALARDFIAAHGLSEEDFLAPLVEEVSATLCEVRGMEIERVATQRDRARAQAQALQQALEGQNTAAGDDGTEQQSSLTRLALEVADAKQARVVAERQAAELKAELQRRAQQAPTPAVAITQAGVDELAVVKRELEHATHNIAALQRQVERAEALAAEKEAQLQAHTFDKFVHSAAPAAGASSQRVASQLGSHDTDAEFAAADRDNDGTLSRSEYRAWARQKAAILAKANEDRAALLRENNRLRAMLDPHAESTEARFRELDEERVRLEADVDTLSTTTAKLEAELKSVYRRWDEDGQRWAMERRRLQEQLKAHADAAAALASTPHAPHVPSSQVAAARAPQGVGSDGDTAATIAKLVAERDAILKNWSEETEILVTIWKQDKEAWAAERARLQQQAQAAVRR